MKKKLLSVCPWVTGLVYMANRRGGMICDACGVELRIGEALHYDGDAWKCEGCL